MAARDVDREQSAAQLERFGDHWRDHGFGLWWVTVLPADVCLGFVGLAIPHLRPEILPAVEVGWRLAHEAWGRGDATEGARAALDVGFGALSLDHIVSITRIENRRSWPVMEKLGMTFERDAVHPEQGTELILYGRDSPR